MSIPKSSEEIKIMHEGGQILAQVRDALVPRIKPGVSAQTIDQLADQSIEKMVMGAQSSFKKVRGYKWATCINVNDGVVHGIPHKEIVFAQGDIVSVDVGVYYKGYHSDTSVSVGVGQISPENKKFLQVGREVLDLAIKEAKVGNRIGHISSVIEREVTKAGYKPITALVGHGIGKNLHEEPYIPCFLSGKIEDTPEIREGDTFAIEIMYTQGEPDCYIDSDGWTIRTKDGKISGLFEETVAVTRHGPLVLTRKDS